MPLNAGDRAPDFSAVTDAGEPLGLKDLQGQTTVLYFYPRADTPG
jgi:thioredoxin-dependent peroxiredoxin